MPGSLDGLAVAKSVRFEFDTNTLLGFFSSRYVNVSTLGLIARGLGSPCLDGKTALSMPSILFSCSRSSYRRVLLGILPMLTTWGDFIMKLGLGL